MLAKTLPDLHTIRSSFCPIPLPPSFLSHHRDQGGMPLGFSCLIRLPPFFIFCRHYASYPHKTSWTPNSIYTTIWWIQLTQRIYLQFMYLTKDLQRGYIKKLYYIIIRQPFFFLVGKDFIFTICKWQIGTWKDFQHHKSSGKWTLKPQ